MPEDIRSFADCLGFDYSLWTRPLLLVGGGAFSAAPGFKIVMFVLARADSDIPAEFLERACDPGARGLGP